MKTRVFSCRSWYWVLSLLALSQGSPALAQDPNLVTTVTIHASDPLAREGEVDTGTFTVWRTGSTNFPLAVFYQLAGSAANSVDYEQLGSFVQIPIGARAASFTIRPIDDSDVEGTETVLARITESPLLCITCGYNIGEPNVAEVLLRDNDLDGTNQPPFVQLNAPQNGAVFTAPADIVLNAFARDAEDGYDLKVEFFEGNNSLGIGTFVPTLCPDPYCPFYALTWSNVPPGNYTLTARATDSGGASSVSESVHIRVLGGVNIHATDPEATERPALSAIPPDTATFTVRRFGETDTAIVVYYEVTGTASNGDDYRKLTGEVALPVGAVSAEIIVDPIDDNFVEGTETVTLTLIPTCPQCLFTVPPCLPPQGTNCYPIGPDSQAAAYIRDNDAANLPPAVRMIGPQNGGVFTAPADIRLMADAHDSEDFELRVEFFEGANSLGFGNFLMGLCPICPFYWLTWSNVPPGQYTLTAKATDSDGASSVSEPVHITVVESNLPPVVNIVARDSFASEGSHFWRDYPEANVWAAGDWNFWQVNLGGTNTATFVLRRQGSTSADLIVKYEIGGTASNGLDYVNLPGSVTIAAGHHSARVVVVPIDDTLVEGIETIVLKLKPSSDYTAGFPSHAAAILIDNDRPRPPCGILRDRHFHLCRPATNGFCFRVEASTDLQIWSPICTNVVTDGALHFVDPDAPPLNKRFYRIAPEPGLDPDD